MVLKKAARLISLTFTFVILTSLARSQDHPQAPCSYQGLDVDHQQLSVVSPLSTTSWQCYANGNCSSGQPHKGDTVVVASASDGWTCGYITSLDGAGSSWIRTTDLAPVDADLNPPPSAWLGTWQGGEDLGHIQPSATNGS